VYLDCDLSSEVLIFLRSLADSDLWAKTGPYFSYINIYTTHPSQMRAS
jgi:hypothetical protein